MDPHLLPGPLVPDVLTLQQTHKSQEVWDGAVVRPLRCRSHLQMHEGFRVSDRVVDYLRDTPFYGIHRLASVKLDIYLISALVERWRQETHTFHFTVGEATVTLQDVQILLGLGITGDVVTGQSHLDWSVVIQQAFGVLPPEGTLKGQFLAMSWLTSTFAEVPQDAPDVVVERYTRAYLLILFATVLFPDKSGDYISVIYLPLLLDLNNLGRYSWGSAVLATLYRNLCRASRSKSLEISGPLILLQLWSWERIAIGRPICRAIAHRFQAEHEQGVHPLGSQHVLRVDPLGCKWLRVNHLRSEGTSSLAAYRDAFDAMTSEQFTWEPYTSTVISFLSDFCHSDSDDWVVICPLICFDIVEWHYPDRVTQQFGWRQEIPQPCDTSVKLHKVEKRGGSTKCWRTEHETYIAMWARRSLTRVNGVPIDTSITDYHDPYMRWYREHTRLFISPLARQQPTSFHPSAAPIHLLTQHTANFYRQFDEELRKIPAEIPPRYRALLVDYCTKSMHCLESLGFAHLIQPEQVDPDQPPANSMSPPSSPPQRAALSNPQSLPSSQPPNFPIQWPDSGTLTLDWIFNLMSTFEYSSRNLPPTDLPKVLPVAVFDKLILTGSKLLHKEPNCVKIDDLEEHSSVVVVGDVHGQFHDVLFLLKDAGYPSNNRVFVFNGDYVDRGAWGFETYVLLLAWKILYPNKVYLLRGNHESRYCTSVYGFEKEVMTKYGDQGKHVYRKCLGCFGGLPLATVIAKHVYTAHGGLFRSITVAPSRKAKGKKRNCKIITNSEGKLSIGSFDELSKARRAVLDPPWQGTNLIPGDVLWSDPSMTPGLSPNSERGIGLLWGPDCTEEFMKKYDLKLIIRSHEGPDAREKRPSLGGMDQGYTIDHVVESGKLITLFSAPDYPQFQATEERYKNKAAYIVLEPPNFDIPTFHSFEAVLPRPKANPFYDFEDVIDSDEELDLAAMLPPP